MYTHQRDNNTINNYAAKVKVYCPTYSSLEEQRIYILQTVIATLVVATVIMTTLTIS